MNARTPSPLETNGPWHHWRRRRPPRPPAALSFISLLVVVLLAGGCGNDESGTPPIDLGLSELQSFANGAAGSTAGLVLDTRQLDALLSAFGLSLNDGSPVIATRIEEFQNGKATLSSRSPLVPKALLQGFGTYDRVPGSTTPPFPGWELTVPGDPPDGFVFRFQAKDDIVIVEDGIPRHLAGEFRFLDIDLDDGGNKDPGDDVLLHVLFETSIVGESPDPVVRLDYTATLDENREPVTIEIGDETDLNASYVGKLSLAARLHVEGDDASGLAQLVDRVPDPDYAVRLTFTATDLDSTWVPREATFVLGYGRTNNPTAAPWQVVATFDNFVREFETLEITADVQGTVSYRGDLAATFAGNTRSVPIDVDGDGIADDTCIDVNITRAGSTRSENICEAFGVEAGRGFAAMVLFQDESRGLSIPFIN